MQIVFKDSFRKYGLEYLIIYVISLSLLISSPSFATVPCKNFKARIVSVEGMVEIRKSGMKDWRPADFLDELCIGDMLRVRTRSRASIRLDNETMIRLDQKTTITISEPRNNKNSLLDLLKGKLHIITRTPVPFEIKTPFVNAGVEGTEFFIGVGENKTDISVFEGKVFASNEFGNVTLIDQESATTLQDQIPTKASMPIKTDVVQWALHYPMILDYQTDQIINNESNLNIWKSSLEFYRQGRINESLALIDQIDPKEMSSYTLIYQASLLLTVGRVEEAKLLIEKVLLVEERNSSVHALLAIIAIVQNDKELALRLANQAVIYDQASPTARLALSYVQQAFFLIEDALSNIEEAIHFNDKNALAWARLAELQMSMGYHDRALESAQQAVNLNPGLAKTQTVLGFSQLLQINTKAAQSTFIQAIKLDQADAMPRLGLGLALIREGELETGRVEIEIAASLDPLNSLVRSYLGKAYFEEKRYPLASTQFNFAKEQDPNDPTPWLYDGIMKQTQNQQVEALQDIEKSIQLNNNRAIYRSRLLLDQDQAVRGTSLSRIYDDLGFEQRALIQASKSLAFDPTSHSSHRFLSDAYSNMPHHEIARASELLQAQLLQPININPVQPRLGATDLNIITGGGPAAAFNEFTPLFERNRPQLVTSGVVGNFGTLGNETILSGVYNRASYSLGQFHYETSGVRPNADLVNNNYDGFLQIAITPKLNFQAEMRYRDTHHGGSLLQPLISNDNARRHVHQKSFRIGASYSLSPKQTLIASGIFIDREVNRSFESISVIDPFPLEGPTFSPNFKNNSTNTNIGYQTEVQYLLNHSIINIIAGGGAYYLNVGNANQITSCDSCLQVSSNSTINEKLNSYIYSNLNLSKNLNLIMGFSYDMYKDGSYKINQLNPKVGLNWDIFDNVRLRMTWFETTKSSLVTQQTIEPSQIAGFNQMFDDPNGTGSEKMGLALDTRISDYLFSGLEASNRDLQVPNFFLSSTSNILTTFSKQQEQIYRAYLYWLPRKHWAFKSEFQFEKAKGIFESPSVIGFPFFSKTELQTLTIPLSLNYSNPSGIFTRLTGTYVHQQNGFFTMDTIAGYRFPNRKGMISFEGKNLLDQDFFYRSFNLNAPIDIGSSFGTLPRFIPDRTLFMRLTLNF